MSEVKVPRQVVFPLESRIKTVVEIVEEVAWLPVTPILEGLGLSKRGSMWVHEGGVGGKELTVLHIKVITRILRPINGRPSFLVKETPHVSSCEGDGMGTPST